MDFKGLAGTKVTIHAKGGKGAALNGVPNQLMVIEDVYVNGEFFRDHAWVKVSRRLNVVGLGVTFSATALVVEYLDSEGKGDKIGVKRFRSIIID